MRSKLVIEAASIVLFLHGSLSAGGYSATFAGVTVKYSLPDALAGIDSSGLLEVVIGASGGALKITADATARANWGDFCPILIAADAFTLKSIKVKGRAKDGFYFHVIGACSYVQKFIATDTYIGGLFVVSAPSCSDVEIGFYLTSGVNPAVLTLKNGVAFGAFGSILCGADAAEASTEPGHLANASLRDFLARARAAGGVVPVRASRGK